jgi:hypothetical protein
MKMNTSLLLLINNIIFVLGTGMLPPPPMGMGMMMPPSGGMMMGTSTATVCGTTTGTNSFTYTTVSDDASGTKTGYPGGYREISSNGCPGYDWTSQTTPNKAQEQTKTVKLPLQPRISKNLYAVGIKNIDGTTNTSPVLGAIGIAINGVSIYGNSDADSRDAYVYEGQTFDFCGGHPQQQGEYHYHSEPDAKCGIIKDESGKHSSLFGFMYDGIPIYGTKADNGVVPTDLDACGGHVDKTYPFYHYHLPADRKFPYTLTCLKGCVISPTTVKGSLKSDTYSNCQQATDQYDYSPLNKEGVVSNIIMTAAKSSTNSSYLVFAFGVFIASFLF